MFEIIGEINFSSLLESFVHKIDESTLFNVFFGFVAVALTRRILSLLLNLLLTLLQKLVNNIFFLKIFVINLSEDKIVNVEWTLVVVGDVTDEFKGFVGHVTGFFGEVACFYFVDYLGSWILFFRAPETGSLPDYSDTSDCFQHPTFSQSSWRYWFAYPGCRYECNFSPLG